MTSEINANHRTEGALWAWQRKAIEIQLVLDRAVARIGTQRRDLKRLFPFTQPTPMRRAARGGSHRLAKSEQSL